MGENNHNACIEYLLNGIDKHFHLIETFQACMKINMKYSKNIDVDTCRLTSAISVAIQLHACGSK